MPEKLPLSNHIRLQIRHIIYEDKDLLIIDKPAGISIMHPGAGNYDNTIVNALIRLLWKKSYQILVMN